MTNPSFILRTRALNQLGLIATQFLILKRSFFNQLKINKGWRLTGKYDTGFKQNEIYAMNIGLPIPEIDLTQVLQGSYHLVDDNSLLDPSVNHMDSFGRSIRKINES